VLLNALACSCGEIGQFCKKFINSSSSGGGSGVGGGGGSGGGGGGGGGSNHRLRGSAALL